MRMDVSTFSEVTIKGQKKLATALFLQVSHIYTSQKYNGSKEFQISRRDFFVPKKTQKVTRRCSCPIMVYVELEQVSWEIYKVSIL